MPAPMLGKCPPLRQSPRGVGVLLPAHGGHELAAASWLPLDPPGLPGTGLRHSRNAGLGRRRGAGGRVLSELLGSPAVRRGLSAHRHSRTADGRR